MNIFAQMVKGDSAAWNDSAYSDTQGKQYTSVAYTLNWAFTGPTLGTPLTLVGTANGSGWRTTVSTTLSAQFPVGNVFWTAYLTAAGERVTIGQGSFVVTPDLTAAANYDGRSTAQQIVDAIDAYMLNQATGNQVDIVEYEIQNRRLKKDRAGLTALRAFYSKIAASDKVAQQMANGQGNPRRAMVRFAEPH